LSSAEPGYLLHDNPESHRLVRHLQAFVIAHVNLMLTRGNFVVAVFNLNPHILKGKDRIAPQIAPHIQRPCVKIPPLVDDLWGFVTLKIEVLQLRAKIESVTLVCRLFQNALKDISRIALIGSPFRLQDIAEHPRHRSVSWSPRQELKSAGVRLGDHVTLFDPGKPLNGRAIKAHTLSHAFLQFRGSDGKSLQNPQDICKPELDETDVLFLNDLYDILNRFTQHFSSPYLKPYALRPRPFFYLYSR